MIAPGTPLIMSSTVDDRQISEAVRIGASAVQRKDFAAGVTLFSTLYTSVSPEKAPRGLSYYGLALAMQQKKYKQAVEMCRKAISLDFSNTPHHANLVRVYLAAGNRKAAVDVLEKAMKPSFEAQ